MRARPRTCASGRAALPDGTGCVSPSPSRRWLHCSAVAAERVRLEVKQREQTGSREARRLRREGLVPGVLYGRGKTPHAICIPERDLRRALTGDHGLHAILDVVLEGQKTTHA